MDRKTITVYWNIHGIEHKGFADFDGEQIRYCKGTPDDENDTVALLKAVECSPGFPITEVWNELIFLCDDDGRLDAGRNPLV